MKIPGVYSEELKAAIEDQQAGDFEYAALRCDQIAAIRVCTDLNTGMVMWKLEIGTINGTEIRVADIRIKFDEEETTSEKTLEHISLISAEVDKLYDRIKRNMCTSGIMEYKASRFTNGKANEICRLLRFTNV